MNGDDYESQLLTSTTTNSLSSPLSPQPESIGCEESSFLAEAMVVPNTRRNSKFRHKTVGFAERSDSGDPEKAGCLPANGQLKVHRLSLHGKPINIKQHKQDARLRRLQVQIYNFLERPRGWKAGIYHTLVFLMVLFCLVLSVLSTIPDYMDISANVLMKVEIMLVVWFSVEYVCRIWGAGCRSRYQGWMGRLRTISSPFCIIDIVVIVASMVVLSLGGTGQVFAASAIRGLRFFQILRMVRIDRRGGSWKLLGTVVWAHRQELITTMYIGFLGLIFASFLVYLCEKNVNSKSFGTFADALWWGVITLCTVGYGDKVPSTWMGKIIASFCALLGISFFALPAGILGSGFALKVQQQQRQKHITRRRVPAASLIQCRWRLYASDENSLSEATWKIHIGHNPPPPVFKPSTAAYLGSKFARMSLRSPLRKEVDPGKTGESTDSNSRRRSSQSARKNRWKSESLKTQTSDPTETQPAVATVSKRRLCLSLSTDTHSSPDYTQTAPNLNDRLTVAPQRKKSSFSYYSEDENQEENPVKTITELTPEWKNLIRFIRRLKYMVSRRKFKEALKPYDVKDVIEQYSAGHVDLLARVKSLQNRLDTVFGHPNGAHGKGENKIGLAQRVIKIERQIDDIEGKLDILIRLSLGSKNDMDRDISSPGSAYSSNEVLSACNSNESVRKAPLKSILSKPKTDTADNIAPCNTLIVPSLSFDLKEKKRVSLCHSAGDVEEFRLRNAQISSSPSVKRSSEDLSFPSEDLNHRKVGRPDSLQSVLVNFDKKGDSGSPGIILTPNTLSVNL